MQIMLKKTHTKTIKSLFDILRHLHIHQRQAELLLNRLMTECCNRARAFHHVVTLDHTCLKRARNVRETGKRYILRCPGRAVTLRDIFCRLDRETTWRSFNL